MQLCVQSYLTKRSFSKIKVMSELTFLHYSRDITSFKIGVISTIFYIAQSERLGVPNVAFHLHYSRVNINRFLYTFATLSGIKISTLQGMSIPSLIVPCHARRKTTPLTSAVHIRPFIYREMERSPCYI